MQYAEYRYNNHLSMETETDVHGNPNFKTLFARQRERKRVVLVLSRLTDALFPLNLLPVPLNKMYCAVGINQSWDSSRVPFYSSLRMPEDSFKSTYKFVNVLINIVSFNLCNKVTNIHCK